VTTLGGNPDAVTIPITQLQRHPQPRPFANLEDFLLAWYVEDLGSGSKGSAELAGSWEAGKTV